MNATKLLQPFGMDVFCTGKKFLVYNMVGRNLKVKYRRSVFGVLWTLLAPLSLVGIYYFAFKIVMKVETPNYLAYLVSGILPWSFFSQTVSEGMDSISGNAGLISKVPVPLQVFPLVGTVTNFITLCLAIPIMLGVSLLSGVTLGPSIILLPVLFGLLALTCYGVSMIFALLYVFFQDLKHLAGIIMQLWFYGTPVLYHAEMIPEKYRWAIYANPIGTTFVSIHHVISEGIWPNALDMAFSFGWTILILSTAIAFFKNIYKDVAENL